MEKDRANKSRQNDAGASPVSNSPPAARRVCALALGGSMNAEITRLLSWLEEDFRLIVPLDEDQILQARDHSSFDEGWVSECRRVDEIFAKNDSSSNHFLAIEKVREVAFKKVFAATGSHELSACASDDLGLIAKSVLCGDQGSTFLESLRKCYSSGRIATL